MISYDYFKNGKILLIKYNDKLTKQELSSFVKFLVDNTNMSYLEEIVADYRDAEITFNENDVKELTEFRMRIMKGFQKIKTIFLVSNPKDTAITYLYSNEYNNFTPVSIFSTINACLKMLSLDVSNSKLEEMINNLSLKYSLDLRYDLKSEKEL